MNSKTKKGLQLMGAAALALLVPVVSCQKGGKGEGGWSFGGADVYVAGEETIANQTRATVWKNGVAQRLTNDNGWKSSAKSVFASGKDVYVAGYENDGDGAAATLWKNGVAQHLGPFDPKRKTAAVAVQVSGNDVYVAGTESLKWVDEANAASDLAFFGIKAARKKHGIDVMKDIAVLWKNGVAQRLGDFESEAEEKSEVSSLAVSGADVYVAGTVNGKYATLWKNGAAQRLSEVSSSANSVWVSGTDVYVAGSEVHANRIDAMLWKNGVAQRLSGINPELSSSASSVFVSGGDVYATGYSIVGYDVKSYEKKPLPGATVWKNGAAQKLGDSGIGRSIFVSGGNVYVAGSEGGAAIWKNGRIKKLSGGDVSGSSGNSVFVK